MTKSRFSIPLDKNSDFFFDISMGEIRGVDKIVKFGENPALSVGAFEDIWDGGGVYAPPTQARLHNVASDSIEDTGNVVSSGQATGGNSQTLIDSTATFQTDGVAVGDFVLNDSKCLLGRILSVNSETQLTITRWASPANGLPGDDVEDGDDYRVVNATGTGASIFFVFGLDENFLQQNEFVVLNGTTPVSTTKLFSRQFRARVFNAGSLNGAVGTITSTAQTDLTISCQIIDGNNQTLMSIYTIPIDKVGFLTRWWGTVAKKQAGTITARLRTGELDGIMYINQTRSMNSLGTSDFDFPFKIPIVLPGGADVKIEADASDTNMGVDGGFDIVLVDKQFLTNRDSAILRNL